MTLTDRVNNALCSGMNFIKSKQCGDGLWRDFDTLAGPSSEWVSGFVLYAISNNGSQSTIASPAIQSLLLRQRDNGGWSYNKSVPTDCDSTAWVLLALSTDPVHKEPSVKRAMQYLKLHQNKMLGGFSTYTLNDGIQKFIQVSNMETVNGWTCVHNDVTSVTIQSLLTHGLHINSEIIKRASEFLKEQRNRYHLWDSYWWKGYAYSTYHALRALSICQALNEEEISYPIQVLLQNQQKDGGWNDCSGKHGEVFATAFVVLSLLLYPSVKTLSSVQKGILWLIDQQNIDGSWPTTPILKIPPPMIGDPDLVKKWRNNQLGTGVIIEDKKRIFTSSAAIWSLGCVRDATAKNDSIKDTGC